MITLQNNELTFQFPHVHEHAKCSIHFQRTLRIPDDDRVHHLPPGLGSFPLEHLDDYSAKLPSSFSARGGIIMPMYQAEAMWIYFNSSDDYPFAIKVATGKICAVSGETWQNSLHEDPQDYVVIPDQPWLDGYCVGESVIRQFVAAPLGSKLTVEHQLTGEESIGGIQFIVYPMKRKRYLKMIRKYERVLEAPTMVKESSREMGLAAGGKMRQEIYEDEYGLDAWDQANSSRCFVTLLNARQWFSITGKIPAQRPISAQDYDRFGLPWFDYYGEGESLEATDKLESIKGLGELTGDPSLNKLEDEPPHTPNVVMIGPKAPKKVREYNG